ncbi:hypothetical protein ACFL37_01285 [Candidatus Margulisiibacteriota bacterium]
MKNYFMLSVICLAVALAGCSTFHEPTPTTTTTTLPAHTFIGVSLGDTTADVVAVLGQPESTDTEFDILAYEWDSLERAVIFQLPTTEVVAVISANGADELNGIKPGIHEAHVRTLLGDADQVKTGSLTYMWVYSRYNIIVSFYLSDNTCVGVVLYWPGRFDIDPE